MKLKTEKKQGVIEKKNAEYHRQTARQRISTMTATPMSTVHPLASLVQRGESTSNGHCRAARQSLPHNVSAPPLDLDWLFAPVKPTEWLADCDTSQPMLIERNDPSFYDPLITLDQCDRLIADGEWQFPVLRLWRDEQIVPPASYTADGGAMGARAIAMDKLVTEVQNGASILIQPGRFCDPIALLARRLEARLSCRVEATIVLTPAGTAAATPLHFHPQNVLVIQISGSKDWRLYEPTAPAPIGHDDVTDFTPGRLQLETTLRAGDLLYFPRGTGHEVVPRHDEHSLHVAFVWRPYTVYDAVRCALEMLAQNDVRLRQALPGDFAEERCAEPALDLVRSTAQQVLGNLDFAAAVDVIAGGFLQNTEVKLRGAITEACERPEVNLETLFRCRPHVHSRVELRGKWLYLSFHGKTLRMPLCAEAPLRFVMDTDDFRVASLPGAMADDEKMEFARTLLDEGFLVRA